LLSVGDVEFMMSAPAVTSTVSVTPPTSSVGFKPYSRPTSIFSSLAMYPLNPVALILTVYVPASSCARENVPSSLVVSSVRD
jgi:hypothetical protein